MSQINNPTATAISSGVIGLGLAAPLATQASRLVNRPEGIRLGRWFLDKRQLSHLLATGLGGVLLAGAGGIFLYQSLRQREKSTSSLVGTSALTGLGVGVLSVGNLLTHANNRWRNGIGAGVLGLFLFFGGFVTAIIGGVGTYYFTRDNESGHLGSQNQPKLPKEQPLSGQIVKLAFLRRWPFGFENSRR